MKNDLLLKLIHAIAEKAGDNTYLIDPERFDGEIVSYAVVEETNRPIPGTQGDTYKDLVFDDMGQDEAQLCADLMNLGIGVYPDEIRFELELLPFIHALIED